MHGHDVGLRQVLGIRRAIDDVQAAFVQTGVVDPSTLPIASPWSSNDLQRIAFEDIFGSDVPINTRSAAMRLPPIARGRNLIVSTLSRIPLAAYDAADARVPAQPSWLYRTDDGTTPQHKLAWTVDDLIFYGWSCWWRVNGADGFPLSTSRLNQDQWSIDADNRVNVDGIPVGPDANGRPQVILIPGLHEGILSYGIDALQDARSLYANVRKRLANPIPQLELHQTGGPALTDDEIDALIDRWAIARQGGNGGVSYTSESIELNERGGGDDGKLMIESRNAAAVDLARVLGVSAGMIDATAPKASLNYETTTGRNQEFVDLDLQLYMTPITARLSLDDVVPRGQHVAFDLTDFTAPAASPTGPALED